MIRFVKAKNGMNIFGQGARIILVTLPIVALGVALHRYAARVDRLVPFARPRTGRC